MKAEVRGQRAEGKQMKRYSVQVLAIKRVFKIPSAACLLPPAFKGAERQ